MSKFTERLAKVLPKNKLGDNVIFYISFLETHHRFPLPKRRLINDELYRIKKSTEIESPLRVFTTDKEYVKEYVKAIGLVINLFFLFLFSSWFLFSLMGSKILASFFTLVWNFSMRNYYVFKSPNF